MGASTRTGIVIVRGTVGLLLAALLASSLVGSLIERVYDVADIHIEIPNGPTADHPGQHDHGLCAVLASTHGPPGTAPAPALPGASTLQPLFVHTGIILPQFSFTSLHSRAPPAV